MLDYLSPQRIQSVGLFNTGSIQDMIDRHLQGKDNFSHQLWALLVFEIWREQYL
jgi:asparagine synthase (glutamine-hydrolysing)